VKAGADDAVELAEALDDAGGVGADGEEGFENRDQNNEGEDAEEDKQRNVHLIHRGRAYLGSEHTGDGAGCLGKSVGDGGGGSFPNLNSWIYD
jgi:hypothetical protein